MKLRSQAEKVIIPPGEILARLRSELDRLEAGIDAKVTPVEYKG